MLSVFFLGAAPMLVIFAFCINTVASLLWYNFSEIKHAGNKRVSAHSEISGKIILLLILCLLLYVCMLAPESLYSPLYKFQLVAALSGFILCYATIKPHLFTIDHAAFFSFAIIAITVLLLSNNLIIIFFVLELINMLVIYSFFFNTNMARQLSIMSASKISASCVYQFILNFFSSIVLYLAINWYISLTGGANLSGVKLWQSYTGNKYPLALLLTAFLLKFGSGPWIFVKINIYRNLNYTAVFIYTVVYLLTIFIFFLNLIYITGITLNNIAVNVIFALSIIGVIGFSGLAFQSSNIFVFLSFSSLINITVFLLQALACIVFK